MTWTWWLVPIAALFIVLIFAPVIGKLWADCDDEQHRRAAEVRRRRRWRP